MKYSLSLAWLYPDLMSTYGDRGNVMVLKKRSEWRGIKVRVTEVTLETSEKKLETCNFIFMGGAQDRQQKLAGKDFLENKGLVVKKLVEDGVPALFVCAAYQAVGKYYKPYQGDPIPGLGLFDLTTQHPGDQAKRLIGNVVATLLEPEQLKGNTIVGFENHGGRTRLGKLIKPLARIQNGFGNNGEDSYEGAIYKNAIGSYFHGPLLSKNPHLADWLLKEALEKKYDQKIELLTLDDELEMKAHKYALTMV